MDETTVRAKIREFIVVELIRDEEYELTDTEGIITGGLMDSFALAEFGVLSKMNSMFTSPMLT